MKKKNVLTMAMSLALVGVIAVGGTMAYLTASDGAVVNTFEFVQGDEDGNAITVTLSEAQPTATGSESITSNGKNGYLYENIVPGQSLNKAPEVTVTAYTPSYVFVKITDGEYVSYDPTTVVTTGADAWKTVDGYSDVYYKEVGVTSGEKDLGAIFTKVKVKDMNQLPTEEVTDEVQIQVAAVAKGDLTAKAAAEVAEGIYQDWQGNTASIVPAD